MRKCALVTLCVFAAALNAADGVLSFDDIHGRAQRVFDPHAKATVLIFISTDCPIANAFAPEINRLCDEYAAKGVAFFLVHTDPALKREQARQHAQEYALRAPILIDARHVLVKKAGATVTPEAALFSSDESVQYLGRINDLYVELSRKRYAPLKHDLREALDALLSGKAVPQPKTTAVGCVIPDLGGDGK